MKTVPLVSGADPLLFTRNVSPSALVAQCECLARALVRLRYATGLTLLFPWGHWRLVVNRP